MTADGIYKAALPSIATLVVTRQDGTEILGSAYLAVKDGVAVTAFHVIDQASTVTARFASGEEFDVSGVIDSDPKRDIALVRVKVFGRPLLMLEGKAPDIGSRAYVIGAPRGLEFTISDGLVSQLPIIEGIRRVQFSCPASPGNSGGPLLNGAGRAIGVVSSQIDEGQNLNFAIPAEFVLGLDASLPTKPWGSAVASASASMNSVSQRECDQLLLDSLVWEYDLNSVFGLAMHFIVEKKNGYVQGVPPYLYSAQMSGQRLVERLATAKSVDRARSIRLELARQTVSLRMRDIDLLMSAIKAAQDGAGWDARANDLLSRYYASVQTAAPDVAPLDSTMTAAMQAVAVEMSNLEGCPRPARSMLRNEPNLSGFSLGCYMFMNDELLLGYVYAGSPGEKLGLKSGDRILSLDGTKPDGLDAFKIQIKAARGRRVAIVVQREGKEKTLQALVPDDLESYK
jgi:S1-C subfamily serine protease